MPCVLLGQDRRGQTPTTPLGPAALREARRGMRLAQDLQLPLVTVIDTAGAALSKDAEEGGLAGEIARCIADMVDLDTPTVSLLLGQGTGEAHSRWCPPTACWRRSTRGFPHFRRRAPAPSSTATSPTPPRWQTGRESGRWICGGPESST